MLAVPRIVCLYVMFHSVATGMFPGEGADLVHHVMAKALHAVCSVAFLPYCAARGRISP